MSREAEETAQEREQQRQQAPPRSLPTPRTFLTDLLTSLPGNACGRDSENGAIAHEDDTPTRVSPANASASAAASSVANPLRALQGKDRNVFLTLHVLFPNELLPALDLLDRGLVTRFLIARPQQPPPPRAGEAQQTTATTAPGGAAAETVSNGQAAAAQATSSRVEISNTVGVSDTASGSRDGGGSSSSASAPINTTAAADATATTTPQPPSAAPAADPAVLEPCPASAMPAKRDQSAERTPPPVAPTLSLYYVRSAQQQQRYHHRSRFSHGDGAHPYDSGPSAPSSYEVRLAAWNCSCPAFAFAAFPATLASPSPSPPPLAEGCSSHGTATESRGEGVGEDGLGQFSFGGLRRGGGGGQAPPVCKHLLACLLVERAPRLFGACVEERVVGVEEAAAWAAGWGG